MIAAVFWLASQRLSHQGLSNIKVLPNSPFRVIEVDQSHGLSLIIIFPFLILFLSIIITELHFKYIQEESLSPLVEKALIFLVLSPNTL